MPEPLLAFVLEKGWSPEARAAAAAARKAKHKQAPSTPTPEPKQTEPEPSDEKDYPPNAESGGENGNHPRLNTHVGKIVELEFKKDEAEETHGPDSQEYKDAARAHEQAQAAMTKEMTLDHPELTTVTDAIAVASAQKAGRNGLVEQDYRNAVLDGFDAEDALAENPKLRMTRDQATALKAYTHITDRTLNPALRKGNLTPLQKTLRDNMVAALDTLPDYHRDVHRGAALTAEQAAKYVPGIVVQEPAFTSGTSLKDRHLIWKFQQQAFERPGTRIQLTQAKRPYYLVMKSKTGKLIPPTLHQFPNEKEVLFKPNTNFKVVSNRDETIRMEEV